MTKSNKSRTLPPISFIFLQNVFHKYSADFGELSTTIKNAKNDHILNSANIFLYGVIFNLLSSICDDCDPLSVMVSMRCSFYLANLI